MRHNDRVMSSQVKSSARTWNMVCVSAAQDHMKSMLRLDSTLSLHQQHKPNLTPMQWLVVVVAR